MDPESSSDCKTNTQTKLSDHKSSTTSEDHVQPRNNDVFKSNEEKKMIEDRKSTVDGLEESTKESSSTPDNESQQRSPLHTAKPYVRPSQEENQKQQKDSKKSKLRKGKWTVEEEQYTAHIIKCFNDGLLTLPEGSTLRGYLADRLNCNPMRITKKFTGACGLTRRVYHLHDRRNASPADVERAKAELNHLEQRFRMRVEQEQSGLPLSHRDGIFHHSQVQNGINPSISLQHQTPTTFLHPWAQSLPDMSTSQLLLGVPPGGRQLHTGASSPYPFSTHLGPWMLPNPTDSLSAVSNPALHSDTSSHFLRSLMTSYLAQVAAASMASPSAFRPQQQHLSQSIKAVENNLALRRVVDECKVERKNESVSKPHEEVPRPDPAVRLASGLQPNRATDEKLHSHLSPVQQLQRGYQAHLESLRKSSSVEDGIAAQNTPTPLAITTVNQGVNSNEFDKKANKTQKGRTEDDEGTILLLDFMKSAQRACGDPPSTTNDKKKRDNLVSNVVEGKCDSERGSSVARSASKLGIQASESSEQEKKYRLQPVAVTDTSTSSRSETSSRASSQPTESSSSIEDSDSKSDKTEPSSGEESEKESTGEVRYRGPPRKRLKPNPTVREFTAQNLAEHSRMMDKRDVVKDKTQITE